MRRAVPVVTFTVEPEEETDHPAACFATDDPAADARLCTEILHRLALCDAWAWFTAKVTATCTVDGQTFTGTDYLGACSYADEDDFRRGPYFEDMCATARERMLASLREAVLRGRLARRALSRLGVAS